MNSCKNLRIVLVFTLGALLTLNSNTAEAQKRKDVKKAGLSHKKEWRYTYENNQEKKHLEAEYIYNKNGDTILEKEYDDHNNTILHKEYKYDDSGNEILQIEYNPKGQVIEKVETIYKNNLKVERKYFDPKGKLKSRKVYEYKTHS